VQTILIQTKPQKTMQNSFAYLDAKSKSIVWSAYAEYFAGEEIMEEGFNINSGYVYIALENGVTISSAFGKKVEFVVYDEETEEETFLSSVKQAYAFLQKTY
jgi:hypothetical protein